MPDPTLDELLRDGAASWLLRAAIPYLEQRSRNGQPWPAGARAVVDELARLADLPTATREMSASGHAPGSVGGVMGTHWEPVAVAAQTVGRDPRHVRRLAALGKIRARRVGARSFLVDVDSLRSVLRRAS